MNRMILTLFRRIARLPAGILPFGELSNLLVDGVTVESWDGTHLVMRTVIQLDGDVMTFATPMTHSMASDRTLRDRHWAKVEDVISNVVNQLDGIVRLVAWTAALAYIIIVAAFTLQDFSLQSWDTQTWFTQVLVHLAVPLAIGALGYIAPVRKILEPFSTSIVQILTRQHGMRSRLDALLTVK